MLLIFYKSLFLFVLWLLPSDEHFELTFLDHRSQSPSAYFPPRLVVFQEFVVNSQMMAHQQDVTCVRF